MSTEPNEPDAPTPLDFATTDEIFLELEKRFPQGVAVVHAGSSDGKEGSDTGYVGAFWSDNVHPFTLLGMSDYLSRMFKTIFNTDNVGFREVEEEEGE